MFFILITLAKHECFFCSPFWDNLSSFSNPRKTRCVLAKTPFRIILRKRVFGEIIVNCRQKTSKMLCKFGAEPHFCAQAWCAAGCFVFVFFQRGQKCVFIRKKAGILYSSLAPCGPCAPRRSSNHPCLLHFPRIFQGFLRFCRKTFTALV